MIPRPSTGTARKWPVSSRIRDTLTITLTYATDCHCSNCCSLGVLLMYYCFYRSTSQTHGTHQRRFVFHVVQLNDIVVVYWWAVFAAVMSTVWFFVTDVRQELPLPHPVVHSNRGLLTHPWLFNQFGPVWLSQSQANSWLVLWKGKVTIYRCLCLLFPFCRKH